MAYGLKGYEQEMLDMIQRTNPDKYNELRKQIIEQMLRDSGKDPTGIFADLEPKQLQPDKEFERWLTYRTPEQAEVE